MISFDDRTGPADAAPASAYPPAGVAEWYANAKLGFFLHWGLYSVPAWAVTTEVSTYRDHVYAEWYANTVRIRNSPTQRFHETRYGVGTSYEDLADLWMAEDFDATDLVALLSSAGGRYVVPTAKHHDGFCLWDTPSTGFNAAMRGPRRDVVAELHAATTNAGLRFGVYYSGALDWHASDLPPIQSDDDLFDLRRNDAAYSSYAGAHVRELIDRFSPAILWNDIDWPDGGKGMEPYGVAALLRHHRDVVPDGVTNDRWGVPYHGFLTREYQAPEACQQPWEATRGLGRSFGHNVCETDADYLSVDGVVALLVEVVSKGGNLLLNVGLTASGHVPELQEQRLQGLGSWLRVNGEAIYDTRPWAEAPPQVMATRGSADGGTIYMFVPPSSSIERPGGVAGRQGRWLGTDLLIPVDLEVLVAPPPLGSMAVAAFPLGHA